ncbi:hypothetical protein GBAR_LOCUS18729, partial [Geodia barretti]
MCLLSSSYFLWYKKTQIQFLWRNIHTLQEICCFHISFRHISDSISLIKTSSYNLGII